MSTHSICFHGEIKKKIFIWIILLYGTMQIYWPKKEMQHFCTVKKSKINILFFSVTIKNYSYVLAHNFLHAYLLLLDLFYNCMF